MRIQEGTAIWGKYILHTEMSIQMRYKLSREHCENTANLCKEYAIPEMEDLAYAAGKAHDIGKYQEGFQRRIRGENIRVEHSTCGAIAVGEKYPKPMNLMMQYCIAGHHTGIPNGGIWK